MDASTKGDLSSRLDTVIEEARGRVKAFQSEADKAHREVRARFEKFIPIAERLVDFANAYLELHLTKQYQGLVLVPVTVAGISFPKHFAASTLDHTGKTYSFISDETRREFEKQHGSTP